MSSYLQESHYFDLTKYAHASVFKGCNYVWEVLSKIKTYLMQLPLGEIDTEIPNGAYLVNPELISIGAGTVIEPGAFIQGPCVIGKNCVIRHGAYIRGNFICGDNCVIGHTTEVKNSIFLNNVHAAHFAYVGDSVLGNCVNLGAGTKLANLRFDNGPIRVFHEGSHVETGLRKFGAIMGDFSQSGCNSVTNPGTLMGKGACCVPCSNVKGIVPDDHMFKSDGTIIKLKKKANIAE